MIAGEVHDLDGQRQAIGAFVEQAYVQLGQAGLSPLMVDDLALQDCLAPEAATRALLVRNRGSAGFTLSRYAREVLNTSRYHGACVQGLRVEGPEGALGLSQPTWVFDRVLVEAQRGSGERVGLWLEGTFVRAEEGFQILLLDRVEEPRKAHADLDLAPCDLRVQAP